MQIIFLLPIEFTRLVLQMSLSPPTVDPETILVQLSPPKDNHCVFSSGAIMKHGRPLHFSQCNTYD